MEPGKDITENDNHLEGESGTALQQASKKLPSREFVRVEKNLASLGFFTPSSKRTGNERSKTVTVTVMAGGKRIEAKATIAPTALFGLPITADQDKWLALNKLLADTQAREGIVTNPVSFTSAELLALLKIYKDSGKNYRDVSDWLDVMVGTTIISEGAVYFAGKRTFGKDVYHVLDRAVSFGKQLPNGSIADKNYVWLSEWQLQNINNHHQFPIDLDTYRQLKNYIAKALVPLLQIWLYATRDEGVFEKRYDELCQILDVRRWPYPSKIREKLGPSLDELTQFGYLADWRIERTSDKRAYKILFFHGEKFHSDRRARLMRKRVADNSVSSDSEGRKPQSQFHTEPQRLPLPIGAPAVLAIQPSFDPALVGELAKRGITEKKARELLANLKPGQARNLIAQLEYAEQTVKELHGTPSQVRNPAGFIISMIERNAGLPDGFETIAQRQAREERERQQRALRDAAEAKQQLEYDYEDYCEAEVDRYIREHAAEFEARKEAKWKYDREHYAFATESVARIQARDEIRQHLTVLTFEEFMERKKQGRELPVNHIVPSSATEQESVLPEDLLAAEERREAQNEVISGVSHESAVQPSDEVQQPSEPVVPAPMMIELISDPPVEEREAEPPIAEAA